MRPIRGLPFPYWPAVAEDVTQPAVESEISRLNTAIEKVVASQDSVHTLRLDPLWDPIREHPRFKALLVKYAQQ